jgi:hypothetical protein
MRKDSARVKKLTKRSHKSNEQEFTLLIRGGKPKHINYPFHYEGIAYNSVTVNPKGWSA